MSFSQDTVTEQITEATYVKGKPGFGCCPTKLLFIAVLPFIFVILLSHAMVAIGNFGEEKGVDFLTIGRDWVQSEPSFFQALYSFVLTIVGVFFVYRFLLIFFTSDINTGFLSGSCPYCDSSQKFRAMRESWSCENCHNEVYFVRGYFNGYLTEDYSEKLEYYFFTQKAHIKGTEISFGKYIRGKTEEKRRRKRKRH